MLLILCHFKNLFHKSICLGVLYFIGISSISAQVNPPTLQCKKSDTIIWQNSLSSCGPFLHYELFNSTSPTGPFALIATIVNPNQLYYKHVGAIGNQYYYIRAIYDCPGVTMPASDTISSGIPTITPIKIVTVENDKNEIHWDFINSASIFGYIIFKSTALGTIPIDTVDANTNVYVDLGSTPSTSSEFYYVCSVDFCGNVCLYDVAHQNMVLTSQPDQCAKTLEFKWNKYTNAVGGISKQEIWVSKAGGPFLLVDTILPSDSTYILKNIDTRLEYCVYVKAITNTKGIESKSNIICQTPNVVADFSYFLIKNVSVLIDRKIQLDWIWDKTADIKSYKIQRRTEGQDWIDVQNFTNPVLNDVETYVDQSSLDPTQNVYEYRIITVNQCDQSFISPIVSSIRAYGVAFPQNTNKVYWTTPKLVGEIIGYNIYYITTDTFGVIIGNNGVNDLKMEHDISLLPSSTLQFCYYVEAISQINMPDSSIMEVASRSPIVCVTKLVDYYIPNVFNPNGVNTEFRPYTSNEELISSYDLIIFDRWGNLIFESKNFTEGWKGTRKNKEVPAGVYTYIIKSTQISGKILNYAGTVQLVR